jgi:uncharacterized protein with gpF-like domain
MINNAIHSALISILKSKRQKMKPAARKHRAKPARWLYPKTTEIHYGKAIRAWFRPMQNYVKKYLKEHSEAILHGDSETSVLRNDATTGRSFNVMVRSLDAWVGKYFSDIAIDGLGNSFSKTESPIYNGLGNIADTVFNFNRSQYEKSAQTGLGIEFPVNEDWWQDARNNWQRNNYKATGETFKKYVHEIESLTEQAVTSGWSLSMLEEKIKGLDEKLESRARFIARDQIGSLNGDITQRRMESAGLSMYIWSTSGDERVRGDPSGFSPNAEYSHYDLDNKLCRWDDSTVYSEDGGKTWIDRPAGWCQLHPGKDYNCRCTALAHWNEIVDEVDEQIDLLSENEDNIPDTGIQGLNVMNQPSARSSNETVQQQAEAKEAKRRQDNEKKARQAADKLFPGEKWKTVENGIHLSTNRPIGKNSNYIDELRDAQILRDFGSTVYLTPEVRSDPKKKYDAIVNGLMMEFKNQEGKSVLTLKDHFLFSRAQSPNVFINLEKSPLTKREIINTLYAARDSVDYGRKNKHKGGRVILKIRGQKNLIYLNVDSLKT